MFDITYTAMVWGYVNPYPGSIEFINTVQCVHDFGDDMGFDIYLDGLINVVWKEGNNIKDLIGGID